MIVTRGLLLDAKSFVHATGPSLCAIQFGCLVILIFRRSLSIAYEGLSNVEVLEDLKII